MNSSQAVQAAIRQRATRLEPFAHQIKRCHVIVDMPHQHRHRGNHYAIRIDITTSAGEVLVTRDPSLDESHRDFQSVLRDAFDAAARHLESDAQRQQPPAADQGSAAARVSEASGGNPQRVPGLAHHVSLGRASLDLEEGEP